MNWNNYKRIEIKLFKNGSMIVTYLIQMNITEVNEKIFRQFRCKWTISDSVLGIDSLNLFTFHYSLQLPVNCFGTFSLKNFESKASNSCVNSWFTTCFNVKTSTLVISISHVYIIKEETVPTRIFSDFLIFNSLIKRILIVWQGYN